ncbi:sister chromatid cohesion 1 protein 2 isoform X3 [Vigna radiata var. radiata]|uniref:Sister chromatid cohesion 1 protein 2 isoform X3 n=1 Tax=Vigna radiata var. radiata TaxID=3916 RepID=A0A1S3TBA9_VIGRR|nr:sister chromatid cohesion 1 protein 2 isoform X3 [Vigna radiata var. radiata]
MLEAKFLLRFGSDPVRVAAFCFKKLRKIQVLDTDISSAADKILQEMDFVSYRVLGYLLLGIVRIYSRKVEYALDDCKEMLINVNKFVDNREDFAHVETLRMCVSIPERLQLDAFELDVLEDTGKDHTALPEEITIRDKDVVCKTGDFGLFSQEKFEEFDNSENTCSSDRDKVGNAHLTQLLSMIGIKVDPLSPVGLREGRDTLESSMFSLKAPMNMESVVMVEGRLENEFVKLSGQDQQIIEDQTIKDVVPSEDEMHEDSSRISQDEYMDISIFCGREEEHVSSVEEFTKSCQVDTVKSSVKETSSSFCNMSEEIIEVLEARSLEESIEKSDDKIHQEKECVHPVNSSIANDIHEELIEGFAEKCDNKGKLRFQEKVSVEDGRLSFTLSKTKNLDVTPMSTCQDDSVGRPKRGATTPESMLISTPAVRDRSHFSKKRRIVIDKKRTVLPNKAIAKILFSAEALVRKRRKYFRTSLTWKRESLTSCHPHRFYEPLLPCCSSKLQLLFSGKKMKLPDSLKIVEASGNLHLQESPTIATPLSPPHNDIPIVPETLSLSTNQNEFPSLWDEEINSFGTDNVKIVGWSDRTRDVASYLHQSFLHQSFLPARNQKEETVLNFSKVFGGLARKEGARLFYEVLVLKTTGYVDVEQNEAYGDIAITKLPKLDQTC